MKKAQLRQKRNYGKRSTPVSLKVGDRVCLYVPSAKRGKAHKFARPFKGPYRILALYDNGADIRSIDHPREEPKRVSLNRLRRCPQEVRQRDADVSPSEDDPGETMEPGEKEEESPRDQEHGTTGSPPQVSPSSSVTIDPGDVWSGRLWQRPPKDTRGRGP